MASRIEEAIREADERYLQYANEGLRDEIRRLLEDYARLSRLLFKIDETDGHHLAAETQKALDEELDRISKEHS